MQPIKTALLSYGMSGKLFHAPFLHHLSEFELYGVWERTKKLASAQYPQIKTYQTLEELLHDEAVELVIVNTPNYTHYDYAKKALIAGKHVVVEKPFTVSVEEGEELIKLAGEKNRLISVYQNRRYDSDYKVIKKVLEQGWLGEMVEAEFHFDRYKEELSVKSHKETPGPGTGALYDLGSHLIDQALQLFGMPEKLFADIRMVRAFSKVDDYFELLLYYPNLRVRLHCSYLVREPLPAYILHGSKGSFIKSKSDVQETALQAGAKPGSVEWGTEPEHEKGCLHTEKNGEVIKEYISSERGNYSDYFIAMYKAIRQNAPVPVSAGEGLAVVKIIRSAFQSSEEGRLIQL